MSLSSDREDQMLLATLAKLEGAEAVASGDQSPSEDELSREFEEVFGLLPYSLPPEQPNAELKDRILSQIARQDAPTAQAPKAEAPEADMAVDSLLAFPQTSPQTPTSTSSRWALPLAAALAVCVLGMALLMAFQTQRHQETVETLLVRLEQSTERQIELERASSQLAEARQQLDMINTVAASVYPLRPPEEREFPMPEVRGLMYVCANHQQWYVSLHGLDPAPEGFQYRLWFLTAKGPVEMRQFRPQHPDRPTVLRAVTMPADTYGVTVSLEPSPEGAASQAEPVPPEEDFWVAGPGPSGDIILASDTSMTLWGEDPPQARQNI